MGRYKPAAKRRVEASNKSAYYKIGAVATVVSALGFVYFQAAKDRRTLDKVTLCPADPISLTVLLVDVTDPLNLPPAPRLHQPAGAPAQFDPALWQAFDCESRRYIFQAAHPGH